MKNNPIVIDFLHQYSNKISKDDNVNMDKIVMNFDGGIKYYTLEYIKKEAKIGSYDKTMYSQVDNNEQASRLMNFFNSNIVKFIFLITQYASGERTQNEPLVANSLTIPPEDVDYYKFFGIEGHKKYIEDILENYEKFKAPKRAKTAKAAKKAPKKPVAPRRFRKTQRKSRI